MVWNIKELCVSSTFLLWTCGSFWRLRAAHFSLSLVVTTSAIERDVSVGFQTESNSLYRDLSVPTGQVLHTCCYY